MKLSGLFSSSFGYNTLRGYAKINELAKISTADTFQREINDKHKQDILRFLENGKYLLFPEVILSYTIKSSASIPSLDALQLINKRQKYVSPDGIIFSSNSGDNHYLKISIPEKILESNYKPFFRLDGNHRLSAAITEKTQIQYIIPFCIVILDEDKEDLTRRIIFNNINSRSIPLSSEQNIKSIITSKEITDEELIEISPLGFEYLLARDLFPLIDKIYLSNLYPCFSNISQGEDEAIYSTLISLLKILKEKELITLDGALLQKIKTVLVEVNAEFKKFSQLKNTKSSGLLIASVYYYFTSLENGKGTINTFLGWVVSNNIYLINELKPESLIAIYDAISESKNKTIFISMPFGIKKIDAHFQTIEKVIAEINLEKNQNIKLQVIRVDKYNKGASTEVAEEIFNLINTSGLLIADLTLGNKNVYQELGFIMGLDKANNRPYDNFILILDSSDKDKIHEFVGFNIRHLSQLRFETIPELHNEIKERILNYYSL